jgi:hypothetical protein
MGRSCERAPLARAKRAVARFHDVPQGLVDAARRPATVGVVARARSWTQTRRRRGRLASSSSLGESGGTPYRGGARPLSRLRFHLRRAEAVEAWQMPRVSQHTVIRAANKHPSCRWIANAQPSTPKRPRAGHPGRRRGVQTINDLRLTIWNVRTPTDVRRRAAGRTAIERCANCEERLERLG